MNPLTLLNKSLESHVSVRWKCKFCTRVGFLFKFICCYCFFVFVFYTSIKGSDWMPFLCGAIVHSHQSFLHVRLTLQTLLVTLPHPHQRLPPERLSGILAEIYSPHLYASETCWSKVISLPLSLFLCSMCEVGQHFNDPFTKLLHLQR